MSKTKVPSYADILAAGRRGSSDELQKTASEAAMGEVFGRETKEARDNLVSTVEDAAEAFGTKLASTLEPTIVKLAEVGGILQAYIEHLAAVSSQDGFNVRPDGMSSGPGRDGFSSSGNQLGDQLPVDDNKGSGLQGSGLKAMDRIRIKNQEAQVSDNGTAVSGKASNTGENVQDYDPGSQPKTSSVKSKLMQAILKAKKLKKMGYDASVRDELLNAMEE